MTDEGEWIHFGCAIFISEIKITKQGAITLIDKKLHQKRNKLVLV
jgi:hypothetical protein